MFSQNCYPLFLFPSKMLCISLWPELASHQLWESKYFMSSASFGRGRQGIRWLRSQLVGLHQDWWALLNVGETKCTYTQMDWKRTLSVCTWWHVLFSVVGGSTRRWQYCWWVSGTYLHLQLNELVIFSKFWRKEALGEKELAIYFWDKLSWVRTTKNKNVLNPCETCMY